MRLIQLNWIDHLKELAYKMLIDMSNTTDFAKVCKINRKYTVESGQYMARRYLTMCDSYSWDNGSICVNERIFKELNDSSGTFNMEHFIINRDFKYALYDGTKKIAEISLPAKCKKYIATIANYLILETETNARLSNCPVYGGSEDESVSFSYDIKMNENNVNKFIDTVKLVSDKIL